MLALALLLLLLQAGCARSSEPPPLTIWAHSGRAEERSALERCTARFADTVPGPPPRLVFLPDGAYNAQVQAAALAGKLPDLLEFDGPFVHNYVWGGYLLPLDGLVRGEGLLASLRAQGTSGGKLYSVGLFDSGLGLFVRRSLLPSGWRLPGAPSEAWTAREFSLLLEQLAATDADGRVLDLKLNYRGEWYTYGFLPALVSAGGDLVRREVPPSAAGALNSAGSRLALGYLQDWNRRFTDANLDDDAFVSGRVAISWVGHWEYPRYARVWGEDLALVPLPDFGRGTRTGQGSWNWGVTRRCRDVERAARFLNFLLEDEQVLEITRANGAVPGTRSALARSPLYGPGGPLHLYTRQLTEGCAAPRPLTPAYPVLTSIFQGVVEDVLWGLPVAASTERAAAEIEADVAENHGYGRP